MSLFVLTFMVIVIATASTTPLDDYVNAHDRHYGYKFLTSFREPNATFHVLNMTSQMWMTDSLSDRSIWWHYLTIIIPDHAKHTRSHKGCLYLASGRNDDPIPSVKDDSVGLMYTLAVSTNSVFAVVQQMPNTPISFKNDPTNQTRFEDSSSAWTWKMFFADQSIPQVVLQMPMTKAAVRAMDTVTSYCRRVMHRTINSFFVVGASKRGWITWLVAAVDKRVIGFASIVMDFLNIHKTLHQHYRSLGGWTFVMEAYYVCGLTKILDTANFTALVTFIDPIVYNERFRDMPKFIISATGDEFFLPDDTHYYYSELTEPKYLRFIPDADHTMVGHRVNLMLSLRSVYVHVVNSAPLPSLRWELSHTRSGGKISLWTDREPSSAYMFYAHTLNDGRRDFRFLRFNHTTGAVRPHAVLWFQGEVTRLSTTHFEVEMERPPSGWLAFMIQVTFDGIHDTVVELSTEVNIIPNTFPFHDCKGRHCYGNLV